MLRTFLLLIFAASALTHRPAIGILSLKVSGKTSIPASYVKFLELGGSRVVPIVHTSSHDDIIYILGKLDGVLFTGGSDVSTEYRKAVKTIMKYAMEQEWFPIWGTCLGFQNILKYEGVELFKTNAYGQTTSVSLDADALKDSRMFWSKNPLSMIVANLLSTNITANTHNWGVNRTNLAAVSNNYRVLGTSLDMDGVEYIAIVEHKVFPIYATQFHPEKVMFEWNQLYNDYLPKTENAMVTNSYFAQFFVNEVRKGAGHVSDVDQSWVDENVIYNYDPIYMGAKGENVTIFEQIYVFDYTSRNSVAVFVAVVAAVAVAVTVAVAVAVRFCNS